jgi:hypothetical protein
VPTILQPNPGRPTARNKIALPQTDFHMSAQFLQLRNPVLEKSVTVPEEDSQCEITILFKTTGPLVIFFRTKMMHDTQMIEVGPQSSLSNFDSCKFLLFLSPWVNNLCCCNSHRSVTNAAISK